MQSKKVKEAFEVIKQAMIDDEPHKKGSYAHSWHCNISAMCFDAMDSRPWAGISDKAINERQEIANDAASRFMKLCFDVEVQQ
tara:strand:- start:290 stop:538 length:249 start_codon:yes stop_codon:yes gene_type:complete